MIPPEEAAREMANAKLLRRQALARLICAEKINLIKDALGQHVPDFMWKRCLTEAEDVLKLIGRAGISVYPNPEE